MALTDASFLLLLGSRPGIGQRFLERPRFWQRVALGLSVGLAQWFKYNGWLLGACSSILAAALGMLDGLAERSRARLQAVWGFGLLAALVAGAVYWPWFATSNRTADMPGCCSITGATWEASVRGCPICVLQLEQTAALSGGPAWNLANSWPRFCAASWLLLVAAQEAEPLSVSFALLAILGLACPLFPYLYWWLGAAWVLDPGTGGARAGGCWRRPGLCLSILTPFYHPVCAALVAAPFSGLDHDGGLITQGSRRARRITRASLLPDLRSLRGLFRIYRWR